MAPKNPLMRRNRLGRAFACGLGAAGGGGCTMVSKRICLVDESSTGKAAAACTPGDAVRLFAVKTSGASTSTWTSSGLDSGRGTVSGPFDNAGCDGGASPAGWPAVELAAAAFGVLPRCALSGKLVSGSGAGGALVFRTGTGGGQPHSSGTSVSTLSIRPERNTACSVGLT